MISAGRGRRAAGWYQDPDDPTRVRHWGGRGWTSRRRPRPGWHLVQVDLTPDPSWGNPGGVDSSFRSDRLLDDPAGDDRSGHHHSGHHPDAEGPVVDRPSGGDRPTLDDPAFDDPALDRPVFGRQGLDGPFDAGTLDQPDLDRPLHAEQPARDGTFRSDPYRAEPFRPGPRSAWAAAAFGVEPLRWSPRPPAGAFRTRRPGQPPGWPGPAPLGSLPPGGWRQSRLPLVVIAGVTLFAVLALLVNLGTGARARFSPVAVDTEFVARANTACTAALGSQGGVISDGARVVATSPGHQEGPAGATPTGATPTGATPTPGTATTAQQPGRTAAPAGSVTSTLAGLATTLRRLPMTPAATPEVDAWLSNWQRYLDEEHELSRAETDHQGSRASSAAGAAHEAAGAAHEAAGAAHEAAADADVFAVDNGLNACTIDASSDRGLEPIP
jgi:hypothetical protein